jgi:quinoprotein glucose dehydrogenase
MSPEEQEKLKESLRDAANQGLFTPSSDKRYHLEFPGAWGGANWGSTAADPATGMVFVRSLEMPSFRKMSVRTPDSSTNAAPTSGNPQVKKGATTFTQICSACHGPGSVPMRSPAALGPDAFRDVIRHGRDQMPAFSESSLPDDSVDALEAFLITLPTSDEQIEDTPALRLPQNPSRYNGPAVVYSGSFSAGWYTSNGLPAIGPPWTQLVAYDLNDGTIKWRVPDGNSPGLAAKGITGTGTVRPRNGPVVTAGGLVFAANSQDRMLRAFDKNTGKVIWEQELEANPEGIPAVYEVNGREYIAFAAGANWGNVGGDPVWRDAFHRKEAKPEAQGYYFLPSANT